MDKLILIGEFFLISLALGVGLFTPIAKTKMTGVGLFKLMQSVCFGATIITTIVHITTTGVYTSAFNYSLYIAAASMIFSYFLHRDEKSPAMWLIYLIQNIALINALFIYSNKELLNFALNFSSVGYLGIVTYGMLLGHWYLVTPKLSEHPLKIVHYFMWAFLFTKLGVTTYEIVNNPEFFSVGTTLGSGYAFNWMIALMRVLWGYVVLGIMSYFGWRLVCMRSIQSATGILYAQCFFVFVGEIISQYITIYYGIYL